jgi:hypothetical protein
VKTGYGAGALAKSTRRIGEYLLLKEWGVMLLLNKLIELLDAPDLLRVGKVLMHLALLRVDKVLDVLALLRKLIKPLDAPGFTTQVLKVNTRQYPPQHHDDHHHKIPA